MIHNLKTRQPKIAFTANLNPCPGSSGVEQWTENPRVGGSNPPSGTILKKLFATTWPIYVWNFCI